MMRNAAIYVIDEKGYELARHAATSFILTQSNFQDIHVFCHKFLPSSSDRLIGVAQENNVRVHFEAIDDPQTESMATFGHITKTAYLKFEAIDRASQLYDRVLYVDHDILFFQNIFLEKIHLEGLPIGAVYDIADIGGLTDPNFLHNCQQNNHSPHYFNSGFMLFDCSKWNHELKGKYFQLAKEHQSKCDYKKRCVAAEQCPFNRLFENNWQRLPLNFNVQSCAKFTDRWGHAPVRHYQGPSKFLPIRPWRNDARDMRLLRHIRQVLGYNDLWYPPSSILFRLNAIRRKTWVERANKAMALLESMSCEPMQAQG